MGPQQVRPELHPCELHTHSELWDGGTPLSLGVCGEGAIPKPAHLCRDKQILEERPELHSQASLGLLENELQGEDG